VGEYVETDLIEIGWRSMDMMNLAEVMGQRRALMSTVLNF
jgi:hypothetical protein